MRIIRAQVELKQQVQVAQDAAHNHACAAHDHANQRTPAGMLAAIDQRSGQHKAQSKQKISQLANHGRIADEQVNHVGNGQHDQAGYRAQGKAGQHNGHEAQIQLEPRGQKSHGNFQRQAQHDGDGAHDANVAQIGGGDTAFFDG